MSHKSTKIVILILSIISAILLILPFALDTAAIKFELEQKISQNLQANFEIKGPITIAFLPSPNLDLKDVVINKLPLGNEYVSNIRIASLVIKPEFFSLFGKKIKIKTLTFNNPHIENRRSDSDLDKPNNKKIVSGASNNIGDATSRLKSSDTSSTTATTIFDFQNNNAEIFDFKNITNIKFRGGYFVRKNSNDETAIEFNQINFDLENNPKKQIFTIDGTFLSEDLPTQFQLIANTNKNKDSKLDIQSPILKLSANGKFSNSDINNLIKSNFNGKFAAEIIDLKAVLNKYISKNNLLYRKVNSTKPIKISADINSQEGEIKVDNLVINSELMSGSGQINANFANIQPSIDTKFEFNNIDIDSIWLNGVMGSNSNVIKSENKIITKLSANNNDPNKTKIITSDLPQTKNDYQVSSSIFNNLNLTAEIRIKTARYLYGNIQDINLYFISSGNGDILLQPLTAIIPGNSLLKINGSLEHEDDIPKFIGKTEIVGKDLSTSLSWLDIDLPNLKDKSLSDYALTSDLLMLPNFIILSNLNLGINNNKNIIIGDLKIDDSSGISSIETKLRVNYLNYNDYFNDTNIGKQYLSPGSLLKKVLWLNSVNSNSDIALLFDKLVYQNNSFDNQLMHIKIGQGYLKLNDINFLSKDFDLKGNFEIDINSKTNPQISIDLSSNNLHYSSDKNRQFFDQFFDLPSMNEFSGDIDLKIANLFIDDWQASDVNISGGIDNGEIGFDEFNLKTYGGDAKYDGSIIMQHNKSINGSFELVGINNQALLTDLIGINKISGITNVSGVINSVASNKDEFLKNLDSKAQFVSANIAVDGFGIYNLTSAMFQPQKYGDELQDPLAILFNPHTKSFFKDAKGAIEINRGSKKFNIATNSVGINGVISGDIDLVQQSLNGSANFIFLTGSRQKQIPINLAINFQGRADDLEQNTNLSQVTQYLQMIR